MNRVAFVIGGNQGDRRDMIERATELIRERIGSVVAVSGIYETEPWGNFEVESGEWRVENFMNRALVVETPLLAHEVLREALAIENDLGRVRNNNSPLSTLHSPLRKYHSRTMDVDIIFFNDEVIDTEELVVPHPRMHLRRFVLEPLAEICPRYTHPILGLTVEELLDGLKPARG